MNYLDRNFILIRAFKIITICLFLFSKTSTASELKNLREELDYSPQAREERREAQDREVQYIRYQQQEYLENQKILMQEDMYYQTHPSSNIRTLHPTNPEQ